MAQVQQQTHAPEGFRVALHGLRAAQKSAKGAPVYSLYVNRPLGRVFAAAAFQVRLTPNQVTYLSAAFTFAGILLLALGPANALAGIGVALLLVLGYALDAADGQLARLRGGGSLVGEWLDHVIDSVKVVVLHLAVAVCFFRTFDLRPGWLLVPLVFAAASSVHFFGMILVDLLARAERARTGVEAPRLVPNRLRTLLKLPMDYGVLCLGFVLLGWHPGFLVLYTLLAAGQTGYLLLILPKWTRDVALLER